MKTKSPISLLLAGLICALAAVQGVVHAQPATTAGGATGVVTGRVSNEATGAVLQGALIRVEGTEIDVFTERDGSYRLRLPAGTHTLEAYYSGLNVARSQVSVPAGQPVRHDFALTADIYRMSEFVVASEREGNALAITLQRQAPNVKNVVSADAFGSLSGNPAELLERIPGVVVDRVGGDPRFIFIRGVPGELNSIQIDGNRRATVGDRGMNFDSIGSDHIESMEIIKAPTPDMDADAIGGTVNLKSRSAFDLTGRRIRFSVGGLYGYRRYEDPRPAATIFYSDVFNVFGGENNLGISFTSNFRQHVAHMDFSNIFHQNTAEDPAYIRQISFDGRVNQRTRWGGGLKLDYKLGEDHAVFANFTMSPHSERAHVPVYTVTTAQTVATLDAQGRPTGSGAILPGYTSDFTESRAVPQSRVTQSYLHRERDNDAYSAQLGGRLVRPGYELDYDVSYSVSEQSQFYRQSSAAVAGVGWIIDRTNGWKWTPNLTFTDGPDPFDLDAYRTNLLLRFHQPTEGAITGAQLNLRRNFDLAVPAFVKAGMRFRNEEQIRKDFSRRWRYAGPDGRLDSGDEQLSQFVSETWHHRPYNGHYPAFPVLSPDEMWDGISSNPALWQEDVTYGTTQRLNNDQRLDETVYATYIMGNVRLGRVSVLAGVRVEQTEVEGTGPLNRITDEERARRAAWVGPVTDEETIRRLTAQYGSRRTVTGKYRDVFPGVHFKYEPLRGLVLRGSYSTSIGRPNFGSILPREVVDEEDMIVTTNNTKLKPQYSDNFDITAEYYFEPVGLLSAGVFLKEISDFIFSTTGEFIGSGSDNGFGGDYAGYELRSQANGGFAKIKGWEANYQQQYTFLPGWLSGFGAFANYTWLDTEGDYGGSAVQTSSTLPNFTPRAANIGLSYIRGRFNLRVAYGMAGKTLTTFNAQPHLRVHRLRSDRVDLKTKLTLTKNYEVYFDVYNLANNKPRLIWGDREDRPRQILDRNDPQLHFGINGRF